MRVEVGRAPYTRLGVTGRDYEEKKERGEGGSRRKYRSSPFDMMEQDHMAE